MVGGEGAVVASQPVWWCWVRSLGCHSSSHQPHVNFMQRNCAWGGGWQQFFYPIFTLNPTNHHPKTSVWVSQNTGCILMATSCKYSAGGGKICISSTVLPPFSSTPQVTIPSVWVSRDADFNPTSTNFTCKSARAGER